MPNVTFILPDESEVTVEALAGDSLMQTAVDNGIEEITADCGGCCSCATCHAYIDEAWLDKLPRMEGMEDSMLEAAVEREPNSRLTCQIQVTEELDGLTLKVAPAY